MTQNVNMKKFAKLTARELEVLGLVAEGLKDQEIADRLVVAKCTVICHLKNVRQKLGARNRIEAVSKAEELLC